jgi:hypothetical protein
VTILETHILSQEVAVQVSIRSNLLAMVIMLELYTNDLEVGGEVIRVTLPTLFPVVTWLVMLVTLAP